MDLETNPMVVNLPPDYYNYNNEIRLESYENNNTIKSIHTFTYCSHSS